MDDEHTEDESFELWDIETRNVVGAYATEAEALAAVRSALNGHGRTYVASWALIHDTDDQTSLLAEGALLVERAQAAESAGRSAS
jgi:hypothetical protein